MLQINRGRHKAVHSDQLERWLGAQETARVTQAMQGWYGPPIAVAGVPGRVYVGRDGDFCGDLHAGWETNWRDRIVAIQAGYRRAIRRMTINQKSQCNAGFASVTDLITEAKSKRKDYFFRKDSATINVAGGTVCMWSQANDYPPAGGTANSAPGGLVFDSSTTGTWPFQAALSGDTTHFINCTITDQSTSTGCLLIYDRLFGVTKLMNSTVAEAVTGVPTRYQSTTSTNWDYIGGNFMSIECRSGLASTAHNWTVCTYTDQGGAAGTFPSITGFSSCNVNTHDMTGNMQWFAPLAAGDVGVGAITQIQCSAAVATGVIDFSIGHPIAMVPYPYLNFIQATDGISGSFNLTRIHDTACLAIKEIGRTVGGGVAWNGFFTTVSG